VVEWNVLVEGGDWHEEPTRGQGPVECWLIAVVVEEGRSDRGVGDGIFADPVSVERLVGVAGNLFIEACIRIGHPGGEPDLVACVEGACCGGKQDA